MTKLNNYELHNIVGGVNYLALALITALVAFSLAFLDGFVRPIACKK